MKYGLVSIAIDADYSYEVKNSEIWAPAFYKHNNSFIAAVYLSCHFEPKVQLKMPTQFSVTVLLFMSFWFQTLRSGQSNVVPIVQAFQLQTKRNCHRSYRVIISEIK